MKGSKLLLIFIFLITAVLGGAAIWIGWRLSQEPEITPEPGEAAARYYPPSNHRSDCDNHPQHSGVCDQDCCHADAGDTVYVFLCPTSSTRGAGNCFLGSSDKCECSSANDSAMKRQGPGTYCLPQDVNNVLGLFDNAELPYGREPNNWGCYGIQIDVCSDENCTPDKVKGYNRTECSLGPDECAGVTGQLGGRVTCEDDSGEWNVVGATVNLIWRHIGTVEPNTTSSSGEWNYGDAIHQESPRIYIPANGLANAQLVNTTTGEVRSIPDTMSAIDANVLLIGMDTGDTCSAIWGTNPGGTAQCSQAPSDECTLNGQPVACCSLPCNGSTDCCTWDSWWNTCRDTGAHPEISPWRFYAACWISHASYTLNDFDFTFTDCGAEETLTCDSLTWDPDTPITEDDLRSSNITRDLTTTISSGNVAVSATDGYVYGTDISGATFSNNTTNGAANTITIPQGTSNGTYHIWVMVNGTGNVSGGTNRSGCSDATSCIGGGDNCVLTFTVGAGTCDCESVTRSPSTGNPLPGSNVSFTMNAADQNGVACNVDARDVTWSTTGSPALTEVSRDPTSSEAATHNIVYEIPASASSGTEYCVSAIVTGNDQVEDCEECFTVGDQELPAFVAAKTAQVQCINNNTAARITYTITVRNISDVSGVIEYVEDTYDSRFQSSWVSNISPTPDSHTGNVIRWDNNDAGYTLAAGAESVFSYVVTVPSDYFGTYENGVFVSYQYRNAVMVKPQNQDAIPLHTVVQIVCQPSTGIINNAVSASLTSLLLILVGLLSLRYAQQISFITRKLATVPVLSPVVNKISDTKDILLHKIGLKKDTNKKRFERDFLRRIDKD